MKELEFVKPGDIEKRSFAIIAEELAMRHITIKEEEAPITMRVIHTSADFEYADTMTYSENAIETARILLQNGADLGGQVHCFMADEDVAQEAKTRGVTRATVSMERAAKLEKPVIFAVGNAPTALISLYEMMQEGIFKPAFVIGVPVGFVNVVAAKELIMETDVPYIVNRGRKGGSNIAAAICNGLLYGLRDR